MNERQQRSHGQAIGRVHQRIDTLAECVDLEVDEKMTELRTVVTRLDHETRTQYEMSIQDIRIEYDLKLNALSKRIEALENTAIRQLVRWVMVRVW